MLYYLEVVDGYPDDHINLREIRRAVYNLLSKSRGVLIAVTSDSTALKWRIDNFPIYLKKNYKDYNFFNYRFYTNKDFNKQWSKFEAEFKEWFNNENKKIWGQELWI